MDELRLKENTLLLTRSGTIGNISYVSKTLAGCVFSDDVIRVAFKKSMTWDMFIPISSQKWAV